MLFKKVSRYEAQAVIEIKPDMLVDFEFEPRQKHELSSFGLLPIGVDGALVLECNGFQFFKFRRNKAVLPTQVVNEEVERRVGELTYVPSRAEKSAIKEDAIFDLLREAFTVGETYWLAFDKKRQIFYINQSASKAEDCLGLLRSAVGSLPVRPTFTDILPEFVLTNALIDPESLPKGLTLGDAATVDSNHTKEKLTVKNMDLTQDVLAGLLDQGFMCKKLSFDLEDVALFTIDGSLHLTCVALTDVDEIVDGGPEDILLIELAAVERCYSVMLDYAESLESE